MGINTLGTVLIAVGFLASIIGVGLMFYSVEDQERNDGWFFQDAERTDENVARYNAGRVVSILGLVVLLTGLAVGFRDGPSG